MSELRNYDWQSVYESRPSEDRSYLVEEFYVPALERSVEYDRIAGYFNSGSLAAAAHGIETLVDNGGRMRLIAGTQLQGTDKPVLESLADDLSTQLSPIDDSDLDDRLTLLAWLLREKRLEIKLAVPKRGNWGIFHPKVGTFRDESGNAISFEGSINETGSGWTMNYERFKVHRSWVDGQGSYVDADRQTFDRLWTDEHDYVDVYPLPEAVKEELIDWKAPENDTDLQTVMTRLRGPQEPTDADKIDILANGQYAPGGIHLAEEVSTVTPWPHQRVVSDTAVNTYPNSFLFCDEVGLGKTIETGLTLSRLGLTGELNTGLVLAPASLVVQWQEELWEKFNVNTFRYDRGSEYEYVFTDAFGAEHDIPTRADLDLDPSRQQEAWTASPIWRFINQQQARTDGPTIIVMSWHTARLSSHWDEIAPADEGTVRTCDDIPASCRGRSADQREGVWDAVVVDETHNGRRGSNLFSLLERLREHTHCDYLLTATPMQLHHSELYDLLSLIDLPVGWDDRNEFVDYFETRQALKTVLKGAIRGEPNSERTANTSQATLDGAYQDHLNQNSTFADAVLEGLVHELDLEDEGRGVAKQRLLTACNLARSYGQRYDDYVRKVDRQIRESDIDPFEAKEDKKLQYLLLPESEAENRMLLFSRNDRLHALDELSPAGWELLADVLSWATPVDALIHRNTRDTLRKYEEVGLLDATVPQRRPQRRRIELNDETRPVYDRIEEYTSKFYKKAQQSSDTQNRAIGFVMTTYRQRLTSSIYAIARSLSSRLDTLRTQRDAIRQRKRVEERTDSRQAALEALAGFDSEVDVAELEDGGEELLDIDLTELAPSLTDEGIALLEEEIEELESFIHEVDRVDDDPKIGQLFDDLQELDRQGHDRVIVFTQYKDTMRFVRGRLRWKFGENIACYSGDGGEIYDASADAWKNVGKEHVKREFSSHDGDVDVLLCTDSASEGLNLQECGALINYDLPWNPMRVEQRIGRIDRIGQKYSEVKILNYSYEDTIESDIYDRLDDRIGLFENVVGNMQPVLSSVGSQIKAATLDEGTNGSTRTSKGVERELDAEIDEQQQATDSLELKDSLAGTDPSTEEDIVEDARLHAWESYSHPDIGNVGMKSESERSVYSAESVRQVFIGNSTFRDADIEFTPVPELALELDLTQPDHAEEIYRLSLPSDEFRPLPQPKEETIAALIAPSDGTVAVTFSPDYADTYPSLHLLLPGSPIFNRLLAFEKNQAEEVHFLNRDTYGYPSAESQEIERRTLPPWIACEWSTGDEGRISLDSTGAVVTGTPDRNGSLFEWCSDFVSNRNEVLTTSDNREQ